MDGMSIQYITNRRGQKLAYMSSEGESPTIVFCGGYRSDMTGTKAEAFENFCKERGQAYVRFDYSGHGSSDGDFNDGTIGAWADDAITILDEVVKGDVVLIGSSMGGWIAFLVAKARAERIRGMIGIAAAPDFTEDLYSRLSEEEKQLLVERGYAEIPNDYSNEPYHFPLSFYEEAKQHLILKYPPRFDFPVHLFQGMLDKDVLPQMVQLIQAAMPATPIDATFIEDGDHRLSRPQDISLICEKIAAISE